MGTFDFHFFVKLYEIKAFFINYKLISNVIVSENDEKLFSSFGRFDQIIFDASDVSTKS